MDCDGVAGALGSGDDFGDEVESPQTPTFDSFGGDAAEALPSTPMSASKTPFSALVSRGRDAMKSMRAWSARSLRRRSSRAEQPSTPSSPVPPLGARPQTERPKNGRGRSVSFAGSPCSREEIHRSGVLVVRDDSTMGLDSVTREDDARDEAFAKPLFESKESESEFKWDEKAEETFEAFMTAKELPERAKAKLRDCPPYQKIAFLRAHQQQIAREMPVESVAAWIQRLHSMSIELADKTHSKTRAAHLGTLRELANVLDSGRSEWVQMFVREGGLNGIAMVMLGANKHVKKQLKKRERRKKGQSFPVSTEIQNECGVVFKHLIATWARKSDSIRSHNTVLKAMWDCIELAPYSEGARACVRCLSVLCVTPVGWSAVCSALYKTERKANSLVELVSAVGSRPDALFDAVTFLLIVMQRVDYQSEVDIDATEQELKDRKMQEALVVDLSESRLNSILKGARRQWGDDADVPKENACCESYEGLVDVIDDVLTLLPFIEDDEDDREVDSDEIVIKSARPSGSSILKEASSAIEVAELERKIALGDETIQSLRSQCTSLRHELRGQKDLLVARQQEMHNTVREAYSAIQLATAERDALKNQMDEMQRLHHKKLDEMAQTLRVAMSEGEQVSEEENSPPSERRTSSVGDVSRAQKLEEVERALSLLVRESDATQAELTHTCSTQKVEIERLHSRIAELEHRGQRESELQSRIDELEHAVTLATEELALVTNERDEGWHLAEVYQQSYEELKQCSQEILSREEVLRQSLVPAKPAVEYYSDSETTVSAVSRANSLLSVASGVFLESCPSVDFQCESNTGLVHEGEYVKALESEVEQLRALLALQSESTEQEAAQILPQQAGEAADDASSLTVTEMLEQDGGLRRKSVGDGLRSSLSGLLRTQMEIERTSSREAVFQPSEHEQALQAKLEAALSDKTELEQSIDELTEQIRESKQYAEDLRARLEIAGLVHGEKVEELAHLQSKYTAAEQELQKANKSLQSMEASCKALEKQIAQSEGVGFELEEVERDRNELRFARDALEQECSKLRKRFEEEQARADAVESSFNQLESRYSVEAERSTSLQQEVKRLQLQITDLERELAAARDVVTEAMQKSDSAAVTLSHENERLQSVCDSLRTEIHEIASERDRVVRERDALVVHREKEQDQMEQQVSALSTKLAENSAEASARIVELEEQLAQAKQVGAEEASVLRTTVEKTHAQLNAVHAQLQVAEETIEELRVSQLSEREDKFHLGRERDQLKELCDCLEGQLKEQEQLDRVLNQRLQEAEAKAAARLEQTQMLEIQIKDLTAHVSDQQERLAQREKLLVAREHEAAQTIESMRHELLQELEQRERVMQDRVEEEDARLNAARAKAEKEAGLAKEAIEKAKLERSELAKQHKELLKERESLREAHKALQETKVSVGNAEELTRALDAAKKQQQQLQDDLAHARTELEQAHKARQRFAAAQSELEQAQQELKELQARRERERAEAETESEKAQQALDQLRSRVEEEKKKALGASNNQASGGGECAAGTKAQKLVSSEGKAPGRTKSSSTAPTRTAPPSNSAAPPPPAPPMCGGGGAPPPPPMIGGAPGMPPPPPMLGGVQRPPETIPSVKMKSFMWTKLNPRKSIGTMWASEQVQNFKVAASDMPKEEIESLFSAKEVVKKAASAKKDGPVTLIDPRRGQNVAILVSTLKRSNAEIVRALYNMDESVFSGAMVRQMQQYAPSDQEMEILREYRESNPDARLGKAEEFYLAIGAIPHLSQRLDSFAFKVGYVARFEELRAEMTAMADACTEVNESMSFVLLLKVILDMGNFINGGTYRGRAAGFRLQSLPSLSDTKSQDGKMTLLQYIVRFVTSKHPHLLGYHTEIPSVAAACKFQFSSLAEEVRKMQLGVEQLGHAVGVVEKVDYNDRFREYMTAFYEGALSEIADLVKTMERARDAFTSMARRFGEDENEITPEAMLMIINNFTMDFLRAEKHWEGKKKAEAAQRVKEEQRKRRMSMMPKPAIPQKRTGGTEVDSVFSELQSATMRSKSGRRRTSVFSPLKKRMMEEQESLDINLDDDIQSMFNAVKDGHYQKGDRSRKSLALR